MRRRPDHVQAEDLFDWQHSISKPLQCSRVFASRWYGNVGI